MTPRQHITRALRRLARMFSRGWRWGDRLPVHADFVRAMVAAGAEGDRAKALALRLAGLLDTHLRAASQEVQKPDWWRDAIASFQDQWTDEHLVTFARKPCLQQ